MTDTNTAHRACVRQFLLSHIPAASEPSTSFLGIPITELKADELVGLVEFLGKDRRKREKEAQKHDDFVLRLARLTN